MRTVTVLLECDGCHIKRQSQYGVSIDELREQLATVGWLSDKANDRDACSGCLAAGRVVSA